MLNDELLYKSLHHAERLRLQYPTKAKEILKELRELNNEDYVSEKICCIENIQPIMEIDSLISNNFRLGKISEEILNSLSYSFIDRKESEYNADIKQLIVALVIKSEDRFFLLSNNDGDMHTYMTLIQGHVSDNNIENIENRSLSEICKENLIREFFEEINPLDKKEEFSKYFEKIEPSIFLTIDRTNYSLISNYHIGIIYTMEVPMETIYTLRSNESKNTRFVYDMKKFPIDSVEVHLDDWVYLIINQLKSQLSL